MMLPRHARTPLAVLVEERVPSSLRMDVFGGRDLFLRMRRGEVVHGLVEPFREQPREDIPVESDPALIVTGDRYAQARFACSASVFGASDVVVFVPLDADGEAPERIRIPIPSLDRPSFHPYELVSRTRMECRYRVAVPGDTVPTGGAHALSAL